ncbi:uncharacterized protein [Parasteatoda tepidariorum]|uniref:uncharacterized protein n=1 Tax=Parasteatoda tepidariorum TaxID=114398 RepID=UPI001C71A1D4|nr:uncharacterized protein LOC107449744 [Parasteatoda tepidariorum]
MYQIVLVFVLLSSTLQVIASGSGIPPKEYSDPHRGRKPREIRKESREGRLLYQSSDEAQDPKKMVLFQNRPGEPLHDLYRKGFSYLHVPDFHRQAVEERTPRQGGVSNQSIDDIISGIIHLLGGDVHVTRPETKLPPVIFPASPRPTRINDRGPAHFDQYPKRHPTNASRPSSPSVSSSSVIDISSSSTNKIFFPDATDVSAILGLINKTDSTLSPAGDATPVLNSSSTFIGDGGNVSSGELEIVEIVPSIGASISSYDTSKTDSLSHSGTQIMPTGVLTELDKNGHTFIETFVSKGDSSSDKSSPKTTINYTELPIILPSTNVPLTGSSSTHKHPSGPVTEWLPIPKPPERGPNYTSSHKIDHEEPVIITREPDSFEITVTRQMYNNQSETKAIPTFTSLITPTDVTSTTDISVSIISTKVDVIYGRPSVSALPPPPPPLPPPTGRPQVYPVDISELRPSSRPNMYPRPRPPEFPPPPLPKYGNSLRPLPIPKPGANTIVRKPPIFRPQPPQLPEIRIDTCVVGDDTTCDVQLKEQCRTERGVSSCLCRPGYGRNLERTQCTPVVSMLLTVKVAKLADKSIDPSHFVPGSPEYQRLNFEASHAVSTLFGYSPLSDAYRGAILNRIYFIANRMVINSTVHLSESEVRGSLRHHVEHAVATAISRRENRLGTSQLYVNGPLSALVEVEDLNECKDKVLNDCSEHALCDNLFGSFQCKCKPGYTDKYKGDPKNEGRVCSACSPDYCNGKGQCVVVQGRQECRCRGNYGGSRCQVDNEVVGVSVGVSVIAIIVIAITAACLYLWNRRWKRAHQKSEAAKHAGYRLQTMADHVRWGPTSPLGSTYVPSESTMQLSSPQLSASASQLYAISTIQPPNRFQRSQMYHEDDSNPYGKIIRTLQRHNSLNHSGGLHYDTLNSECASSEEMGFPSVPSNSFVYHGTFDRSKLYR